MFNNVSLRRSTFCQQKDFQKPFPNQNSEQLLYIFSISTTIIPQFPNIARGKEILMLILPKIIL